MDKSTVVVLVIIAILVIGVMLFMSSQQARRDRELQMMLASANQPQPQANVWSSISEWGNLVNAIGGLFSGGGDSNNGEELRTVGDLPMYNSDTSPYIDTYEASQRGLDNMVLNAENVYYN